MQKKIEFYKHNLSSEDKKECMKVLNSLFLTTGTVVEEFEKKLASYLETKCAVGVTSCTDALFLSLKCLGIKNEDEVITTPMSFIATANAIEYCGAKPVFVDVEGDTGNIDAELIEAKITKRTRAIIPVHLYGQMADMEKIKKIARKYKLKIVEDAAHCIEGLRDGIRVGELGDLACFSFYAIKNITSGEGGAISTNDRNYYEWLKKARLHGMSKGALERYAKIYEHYDMEFLGFKCNMNNIQASLLIHQLDKIEKYLQAKEKILKRYNKGFENNPNIDKPKDIKGVKQARHIYTIWVDPQRRDFMLRALQNKGIGAAVNFRPIHLMKYYKDKYGYKVGMFPNTERIGSSTITLPLYPKLRMKEVDFIIDTVNELTHN